MQLLNFTPHMMLHLHMADGTMLDLPQVGMARCAEHVTDADPLPGIDVAVVNMTYGDVTGLPAPQPGTCYLVSQLVVRQLPERTDLFFPQGLLRNAAGDIIGFTALARMQES